MRLFAEDNRVGYWIGEIRVSDANCEKSPRKGNKNWHKREKKTMRQFWGLSDVENMS